MLVSLPSGELQQQHRLEAVEHRETDLPAIITSGGLLIGHHRYHGHDVPVYLPTNNLDELCLPHVVIGGMGSGKTRGFASNLAVEAVRAGYTAIVIDPAKGEIGDEIETVLPYDNVIRYRLGERPIAIDWRETKHAPRGKNRLANELAGFIGASSDEVGVQTVRYLKAAAKAAPSSRLSEVVALLTEPEYLAEQLPRMSGKDKAMWEQFHGFTDGRRVQIAQPVLNHLDIILGDDYLSECMDASAGIDMVELMEQPGKAVVIDIPKELVGAEVLNVLGALIASKIDLAMVLRESRHPVFVIMDEPHSYIAGARTWRSAAVESRKYRVGYCWLFHSWVQIPRDVAAIIQAAGPHYHLYTSSKATYQALKEEIEPWSVEECLRIPRHHALHVIRAGGSTVEPFLARMLRPPSMRK